jgi:glycosyltransferase involved in cell wall biosynthesis
VIARDAARTLRRCLESTAWAEESVVVVDAMSTDDTEEIAREMGARVLVHPYEGNIEQKNFALEQTKHDWILAIDADEAVSEPLGREISETLARDGESFVGYELNRLTYHLGCWHRHGDWYPDWQLRLFRRSHGRWDGTNPHGRVVVDGPVRRLPGHLEHYSYEDLADQMERVQSFSTIQARALYSSGRRAGFGDLLFRPAFRFFRAYVIRLGFLEAIPGLVAAMVTAFYVFLKYAKLWELTRVARPEGAEETKPGSKRGEASR